jgi:hypothetical protein
MSVQFYKIVSTLLLYLENKMRKRGDEKIQYK